MASIPSPEEPTPPSNDARSRKRAAPSPSPTSSKKQRTMQPTPSTATTTGSRQKRSYHRPRPPENIQNATTPTAVRVALLPQLHAQVMSSLTDELRDKADKYEIQNLVVAIAVDAQHLLQLEPTDSEEMVGRKIVERVLQLVLEDRDRTSKSGLPHEATYWADQKFAQVLGRYEQVLQSPEMQRKRAHRHDQFLWTEEDVQRFYHAARIYGDGPGSNRLIAQYIGNGVKGKHVAYFKLQYANKLSAKHPGVPLQVRTNEAPPTPTTHETQATSPGAADSDCSSSSSSDVADYHNDRDESTAAR